MGTLDVSILELSDGIAEVLASCGDTFLGGKDYDDKIVEYIINEFKKEYDIDLSKDTMAYSRIIDAAEKAKIELSTSTQTDIVLPYITVKDNAPLMVNMVITKAKFESLVSDLNDKVVEKTRESISKAGKKYSDIDMILLVGGSTRIPSVQKALTDEFGIDLNKSVNPDEAVALGAAIQANTLVGGENASDVLLLDVTPISLGIETNGNMMTKLVDANTTIPTSKTEIFTTATDNQPGVQIVVLQGERAMAKDNKVIGTFNLDGITPAPKGVPQIEVTFEIDANGILSVSAKDKATGKEQHITIDNSNSLSEDEIARIKADAEKYKKEDEKKRKDLEEVNSAQSYLNGVEASLKDETISQKFSESEKTEIQTKIDALNEALKDMDNISNIKSCKEDLEKVFAPLITKIYQEMQQSQQNATTTSQTNTDSNTTEDVSYEEVK